MRHCFSTLSLLSSAAFLTFPFLASCTFTHLQLSQNQSSYNKFDYPNKGKSGAVMIKVFLHIESLREITSETTLDFYLVQFWDDPRLTNRDTPVKVTGRVLPDTVWYPDTYFLLVRSLLYSPEEQYVVFKGNGSVEYNRKVRLKTPCSPDVMLFPFDVVTCSLVLSSFGYTKDEVSYQWTEEGLHIDETNNNVDHIGFFLKGKKIEPHEMDYGDKYSGLRLTMFLKRKYSAYVMQVYFPAALIVILSWTIFWINLNATPARASLGVTTVLTMLTLATQSTSQNAKHVNGKVTAIDVYLWICFVFVIFAMLEFALSDYTTHKPPKQSEEDKDTKNSFKRVDNEDVESFDVRNPINRGRSSVKGKLMRIKDRIAKKDGAWGVVNQMARVLFPLCFVVFNGVYWSVLLVLISRKHSFSTN